MIFLGVVAGVFSNVKFLIPGIYKAQIDLREIPLLISLLYLRNPFYIVGILIITTLFTPDDSIVVANFFMHLVALFAMYAAYKKIRKMSIRIFEIGIIISILIVFLYYAILLAGFVSLEVLFVNSLKSSLHGYIFPLIQVTLTEGFLTTLIVASVFMLYTHKQRLEQQMQLRTQELYEAHQELKKTQQKLVQKEKLSSLRIFTAGIAHEINNPLNFINGAIYLMKGLKNKVPTENKGDWQQMNHMLKTGYFRIKKIVRDLTYFSYDTGYKIAEKDIHKIIGMALMMLKPNLPKGVKIRTNYKLKSRVPVHTENFHSVIVNLVSNAVYATVNSDSKLKLIEITTGQVDDNAQITVYNTGKNIPSNEINKIFNPFFTTKSPQEGTGLGLSICYTLITTHHNGQISVENMPEGVKFTVTLPLNNEAES